MTMANPYAPQALASTMGPTQSTVPLVLAPGSLAQAMPPPPVPGGGPGVPGVVPPPTVADPSMLATPVPAMAPLPPEDGGFSPVNGPPPMTPAAPNQSTMAPPGAE